MEKYKNSKLSAKERAKDLLSRLTLEQKIAQTFCSSMMGDVDKILENYPGGVGEMICVPFARTIKEISENYKATIDKVMTKSGGIPPVGHCEAISGVLAMGATSFPSAIALGATFDDEAVQKMTEIIRGQMRAIGMSRALSPVMDVARDLRWGRVGETYGEDPTLCAAMSVAFVKGLQGEDLNGNVAATGKHFLAYAIGEGGLNTAGIRVGERELREVYAKPFQAAITEANLQSVMNTYSGLDGEPVIGSKKILKKLLRDEMKFDGVTVSDYGTVTKLIAQRVEPDKTHAAARALKSGMDVECSNPDNYLHLKEALDTGLISESDLDNAVLHILETKFKLGLFDNPYPKAETIEEAFDNEKCREHSLKLARESMVLLKNDGVLPLKKEGLKIAVIGPCADNVRYMFGCYTSASGLESANALAPEMGKERGLDIDSAYYKGSRVIRENAEFASQLKYMFPKTPTFFDAIKEIASGCEVEYARGADIAGEDRNGFSEAIELAKRSDVCILAIGGKFGWGKMSTVGEGIDCANLKLTGVQEELLEEVCKVSKKTVVLHTDARPICSEKAKKEANAILEVWTVGETGGYAAAEVLFGEYNPAGRLPMTAAANAGQLPLYFGQLRGSGVAANELGWGDLYYVDDSGKPLWWFGEGLSYTKFDYSELVADKTAVTAKDVINVSVTVKNVGECDGEEVIQFFFSDEVSSVLRPYKELAGFKRVFIKKGESITVNFEMKVSQTAFLNEDMEWTCEEGEIGVFIGSSPVDIRAKGAFSIKRTEIVDGTTRGFFAKAKIVK